MGKDQKLEGSLQSSPEYDSSLARITTINLFAASTKSIEPRSQRWLYSSGLGYSFNNNILITEKPLCANGQVPVFLKYSEGDWTYSIRNRNREPMRPYLLEYSSASILVDDLALLKQARCAVYVKQVAPSRNSATRSFSRQP